MKNGYAFDTALKEWSGKPGEDARAAALKKELIALSASAKRILYVASILQECSRTELIEITKIGKTEFDDSITELLALFLVDAPKLIKDEPRFSVPESTAIAIKELASELVPNFKQLDSSARHFINNASKTSSQGRKQKIGRIVNQSIALLNAGNQDSALQTVNTALKVMKDQPDLLMLKGRCLRETNYSDAAIAFHAAYRNGQRKPLLFDMWYQVLNIQSQFAYAAEVATLAIENELDLSTWLPLRARANVQIALMRHGDGSVESSIDMLQKAADDFILAIKSSKSSEYQSSELKLDLFKVNDAAFFIAIKGISLESDLLAFDVIRASIEKGDYRFKNVERLIEVTKRLVAGVDLSTDTQQSKACRQRISQATQSIELARRLVELDEFSLEDPSEYKSAINMLVAS
jgi:tetratricopeptide (TPR) repeat protein